MTQCLEAAVIMIPISSFLSRLEPNGGIRRHVGPRRSASSLIIRALPSDVRWRLCPTVHASLRSRGLRPQTLGGIAPGFVGSIPEGHRPSAHRAAKPREIMAKPPTSISSSLGRRRVERFSKCAQQSSARRTDDNVDVRLRLAGCGHRSSSVRRAARSQPRRHSEDLSCS